MDRLARGIGLACAALLLSCAHGFGEPRATAPRASDYVSALPLPPAEALDGYSDGCDRTSLSTWCAPDPEQAPTFLALDQPEDDPAVEWLSTWDDGGRARIVIADPMRGLRVVDASDPGAPRLIGSPLALPERAAGLSVSGSRALVVAPRQDDTHELLSIALDAPGGPANIARTLATGELRGVYRTRTGSDRERLVLVVDAFDASARCGPRVRTVLREVELGAQSIETHAEVDLGPDVIGVGRRGDFLFVVDMGRTKERSGEWVRAVDLTLPAGALAVSNALRVGEELRAVQVEGRSVRMVWKDFSTADGSDRVGTYHLASMQLRDPRTLAIESECEKSAPDQAMRAGYWAMERRELGVVFLGPRTLIVPAFGSHAVWLFGPGSCTPQTHALASTWLMASPDGTRLIGIDQREQAGDRTLHLKLYDPARLSTPVAQAEIPFTSPATGESLAPLGFRTDTVELYARARAKDASEWLLSVPFSNVDAGGAPHQGVQLVGLSQRSIAVGAQVEGTPWLVPSAGPLVVGRDADLRWLELGDVAAPVQRGEIELWARHVRAIRVQGGVARLRWPSPSGRWDAIAQRVEGRLELVPDGRDPQSDEASASLPLSSAAKLTRIGPLLVASVQLPPPRPSASGAPCRFEVIDVRQLRTARRTAVIESTAPCTELHPLDAHQKLALPHALVLARPERIHDRGAVTISRFALFVLDLRDPARPRFVGPFRTPLGEWAERLLVDGEHLAYAYHVALTPRGATRPQVRHYLREIDFTDPAEPRFGEPMSVAGEPIAIDGDEIYTRDAVYREVPQTADAPLGGPVVERVVRRLAKREGRAELLASFVVGPHDVLSITPYAAPKALLVALQLALPRGARPLTPRQTRIVALDQRDLRLQSEITLELPAAIAGTRDGWALFRTAAYDLRAISVPDPSGLRLEAVLPDTQVVDAPDYRALLLRDGVLLR